MSTTSILDDLQHPTSISASQKANEVGCALVTAAGESDAPEHITACDCDHHTGVCLTCGWIITIGSDGAEYGHRRHPYEPSLDDCPRRSSSLDPSGYETGPGGDG